MLAAMSYLLALPNAELGIVQAVVGSLGDGVNHLRPNTLDGLHDAA